MQDFPTVTEILEQLRREAIAIETEGTGAEKTYTVFFTNGGEPAVARRHPTFLQALGRAIEEWQRALLAKFKPAQRERLEYSPEFNIASKL